MLGLLNLVYFAEEYGEKARKALENASHPVHWYSFAIVGINLTGHLLMLLKKYKLNSFFYNSTDPLDTFNSLYGKYYFFLIKR